MMTVRRSIPVLHGSRFLPVEDAVGYLCYFLFLQCFCHIYQVGGMSFFAGYVEISHIVQPHNVVPAQMLFEDIEHLLLFYYLFQYGWVFFVGNTQQQSVIILNEVEQMNKSRTWEQITIIIVRSATKV